MLSLLLIASAPVESGGVQAETHVVTAPPVATEPATASLVETPTSKAEATPPTAPPSAPATDHPEIVVSAEAAHIPGDPLQAANLASFKLVQAADRAVIRPAAMAYRSTVPAPVRDGIRNFLNNLTEPVVFVNFLLQLKPGKAAETLGRFAINTTVGAAGLIDMAKRKPFKLPYRVNGFAYTLGYYGVKSGPFLFLPLVGPTTARDIVGVVLDRLFVPVTFGKPFNRPAYSIPAAVFGQLDQRAQRDDKLEALHNESGRPYGATREDYLETRQAEIDELRGRKKLYAPPPLVPTVPK
jgi:phospholipid-binding lipoprotein MlaA